MPDISKIITTNGTQYDIKDAVAREAIGQLRSFEYVVSKTAATTPYGVTWESEGTTVTGTLAASSATAGKIYLVPSTNGEKDIFDEYITVEITEGTYQWEAFGNTDVHMSDLGDLAYKDTASGTVTPTGTVTQPTFSGDPMTSTGKFTPAGTVSTPTVTVTPNTASVTGIDSVGTLPTCTHPALNMTVTGETLTFAWTEGAFTQGTLPTKATAQTVVTGIQSATASQPTFTGSEGNVSVSGTPAGTVTQPAFAGDTKTVTVS